MADHTNGELPEQLPAIDDVLQDPALKRMARLMPHNVLAQEALTAIAEVRGAIAEGQHLDISREAIARKAAARASRLLMPSLKRAINASGVIVHTNLGRSVLAPTAQEAVNSVICGYSTLEYSIKNMRRGSRHAHCEELICALTGAEAAIAVNNNAAAVMMVLTEFATEREAVVSREALVEIGGSFRVPDVMAQSHAIMVEVGATNMTHPEDYERAITDRTAMMLKVHASNYRIIGETETVPLSEMRTIADRANAQRPANDPVLVYEDQGSGAFIRLDAFGDYAEPAVVESLRQGADLVSFSGDKLLGGPQAGIIAGKKELIDRLKANSLARVLRLDKMTLAALEATIRLYLNPEEALDQIPTLRMLSQTAAEVEARAEHMLELIAEHITEDDAFVQVVPEVARAGGGALPMCDIETYAVEVSFIRGDAQSCEKYLVQDRPVPIIGCIRRDALLLDARTVVDEREMHIIAQALGAYFKKLPRA